MRKFAEIAIWRKGFGASPGMHEKAGKPIFQAQIRKNPSICDPLVVERTKLPDVNWLAESSAALLYSCRKACCGGTICVDTALRQLSHNPCIDLTDGCRRLEGRHRRTFQWREMPEESCLDQWV